MNRESSIALGLAVAAGLVLLGNNKVGGRYPFLLYYLIFIYLKVPSSFLTTESFSHCIHRITRLPLTFHHEDFCLDRILWPGRPWPRPVGVH
jgi:hypothetical protein